MVAEIERWRDVVGYEGYYEVSDQGRVRSVDRVIFAVRQGTPYEKQLRQRVLGTSRKLGAYPHVSLCRDGQEATAQVHRLVAAAFLGPCPPGNEVRHLNGEPADSRLSNLCYGTKKENSHDRVTHGTHCRGSRNPIAKLTEQDVRAIKNLKGKVPQAELARRFGTVQSNISMIHTGRSWTHV